MKSLLKKVAGGETLTREESFKMTAGIAAGESPTVAAALLAALAMRGESAAELTGCAEYLRTNMVPVPVKGDCADIVGTGGDGRHTFNISTAAALVAAGAGVRVAKHGNRAVSSRCGAADVLEELGVELEQPPEVLAAEVERDGAAFLFARAFHPVMARIAPLRRELGIRTIFNLVGPLANPAHASRVVIGVCGEALLHPFAAVLRDLGVMRGLVVHSDDGMDEISSLAVSHAVFFGEGREEEIEIVPRNLLDDPALLTGTLAGGDVRENAEIVREILTGKDHSARRGAVLLNAAALCMVAGAGRSLAECLPLAARSIDSGAALEKLARMKHGYSA